MQLLRGDLPMVPGHSRWPEFINRLGGPEGCGEGGEPCRGGGERGHCRAIVTRMGLSERAIEISLRYFSANGGHCDCEVVANVGSECPEHGVAG